MADPVQAQPGSSRADQRRNNLSILQAAARLLADDPGVSMQTIADAAGLARPTVYRHYPNRAALEVAMIAALDAEAMAAVTAFPGWSTGVDAVRHLIRALTDLVRHYPVILVRHRVHDGDQPAEVDRLIEELLRDGQRSGVLRDDLTPQVLNATLFALLSAHVRLLPHTENATLAAGVADMFLNGASARDDPAASREGPEGAED